ncbi:MAG: cysteine desulfurase family protein [Oscillospiraceae bacterium]
MEIYLDNSATTKPMGIAIEAAVFAMAQEYGNPSSLHRKGWQAETLLTNAKSQIASAISCDKNEIVFTSGATESNNLGMIGLAMANIRRGKRIVTTAIEHPSVMEALATLEKQGFTIVKLLPNEDKEFDPIDFFNAVDEETTLVCAMYVNNETGMILPINEIAKAVKKKNPTTAVFIDGVQGFMKLPIKLKNSSIDLMSFSGHKVYAPKGVGALYIRRGVRILPQLYGGGQQNQIRPGTEPMPMIVAFGAAVEAQKDTMQHMSDHYKSLNEYFREQVKENSNIKINSKPSWANHIISIAVSGVRSEVMLHFLEQFEIYVSSGSACAKGKQSYVLASLGFSKESSDETIRISFGRDTTTQMIDTLIEKINEGINTLAKKR